MGSNMIDEIDCGNFFDQIDDLIDFPIEKECGANLIGSGDSKDFPNTWNDALPDFDPLFSGNSASDLSAELSVPYEDIVQLEWLSTFMEDSFSGGGMTIAKENLHVSVEKESSHNLFQTSSPVSVLESSSSSSSSSGGKMIPLSPSYRGPQRARSKRPRPATFNPRVAIQLLPTSSSFIETPRPFVSSRISSESENFAESSKNRIPMLDRGEFKKEKKIKVTFPENPNESTDPNPSCQAVRKCLHCEITTTPQWRTGPLGPKTLCNACGVRYKSGRLFPEYRPAASPTFSPSVHSNSHKKVLEMRTKIGTGNAIAYPKKKSGVPNASV